MIHICIRTERAAGRPWNSPSCMPSMLMRDVEGGETDLQWHWLWVQLCSTLFNWFTKKNHDFGLELAEASIHAQVRKLGIWQIPEAGNTRYHWYEYDMNMIWIWYEYDMNMIWMWYEYDMNMNMIWIYERTRGLGSITGSLCFFNSPCRTLCLMVHCKRHWDHWDQWVWELHNVWPKLFSLKGLESRH
jgi:hypothetical protein